MHAFSLFRTEDHAAATARSSAPLRPDTTAYVECDSAGLFNGAAEVRIKHLGQEYRLRQTRNGKLILTK